MTEKSTAVLRGQGKHSVYPTLEESTSQRLAEALIQGPSEVGVFLFAQPEHREKKYLTAPDGQKTLGGGSKEFIADNPSFLILPLARELPEPITQPVWA